MKYVRWIFVAIAVLIFAMFFILFFIRADFIYLQWLMFFSAVVFPVGFLVFAHDEYQNGCGG